MLCKTISCRRPGPRVFETHGGYIYAAVERRGHGWSGQGRV